MKIDFILLNKFKNIYEIDMKNLCSIFDYINLQLDRFI